MTTHLSPKNQAHHNIARQRQAKTGLWTVLSVAIALFGILVLSTIDTPDGTPWLESTLIGQTLATMGLILAAVLPSLLGTRKDAAVVREQVQNSHVKNQRDDMDDKHDEIRELIGVEFSKLHHEIHERFEGVASDFRGVRKDIGRSADDIRELARGHKGLDTRLHEIGQQVTSLSGKIEVDTKTGEIHVHKEP